MLFCLLAAQSLSAQDTPAETPVQTAPAVSTPRPVAAQPAVDDRKLTLHERFLIMKTKSQTYNDYKVIKETVLDGVWKITRDSIAARKSSLAAANKTIAALKEEVSLSKSALQQKETSMQDVLFDSTHISVIGISMGKQAFLGTVGVVLVILVLLLMFVSGRLKLMYNSVKEKADLANAINGEYEEYKRKALDKQTKLSRELQNERNKLAEIRR
jgi:hypothetical protein